ncbi:MAG: helix-turn-helix domain-containing protein, partial [Deltaproteobacteria bacterium]|nr:helix-turn-helix domain-containing protein [Deltaproteobacteria bacterium]
MKTKDLFSTREVAQFLNINEKMVYTLIADKGLPATKVTGKWLFPRHLVEQWLENETINYPKSVDPLPPYHGLIIISGSNDILLDRLISKFNSLHDEHIAVFGNLGSLGGIKALG